MEGLDGHSSNGKLQYKIFAAGIGWATGLILRKAPISGSSTTMTLFPLFSYDNDAIFISSCIVCKYCHIVFASHFLCPKWAAAWQTGSKSKSQVTMASPDAEQEGSQEPLYRFYRMPAKAKKERSQTSSTTNAAV